MKEDYMEVAEKLYRHINPESKMCTPNSVYMTTEKWYKEYLETGCDSSFFEWCLKNK